MGEEHNHSCGGKHMLDNRIKMEAQFEAARLQQQLDQCKSRNCSSEGCSSDEGLGHSGSDGESNRTGSPTLNGQKMENPENIGELDADGKRKEDLYKCRFCDRTFCYLCHLKVHERVHTGEKPYKCSYCDVTFSQLGSLTVHMRIHTGEKPYECRICLKKFRHINSLRRHQRQVHRKTPAEVDAAPRGADCMPIGGHVTPHLGAMHPLVSGSPQAGRSLAGTPQSFHSMTSPYNRPLSRDANPRALKSALEMRSMSPYSPIGINAYASQMAAMNPYMRMQQQQIVQQQWHQQQQQIQTQLLRQAASGVSQPPAKSQTNHSISSMIDQSEKQINKPKKLGFSISALVGEESESDEIEEISSSDGSNEGLAEEVVDVVSDEQSSEHMEAASSPCHSAGNDSHDSGNASANGVGVQPIIDEDLRRALTIDPRTLSQQEKQRLRQKLAEIALRNISQDSGVCDTACC